MREEMDSKGTEARVKIKNVSRPDDAKPTSVDSKLSKTGQIKTKIIDEEKPLMSDKTLGLPGGLIAAARAVMEKKHDTDDTDARKLTGGKTKVDLEPETDDDLRDDSEKKMKKNMKEATHPKTDKEKKLAALAHPKDKITHKDVLVGRGVIAKEEAELDEGILKNIKRGLQGWDPKAIGPGGEKLGSPRDVVNRAKTMDIDTAKSIRKNLDGALAHSPAGLQKRALDRRLSKEELELESLTEEDLEEVLNKSQPAGEWIKDFVDSKDPKFAGKSKKKRMQMALGAYYAKQHNEEAEIEEAAGSVPSTKKKTSSAPVVTKKIDFDKVKQVRDARKAAKQARHTDTSHLPTGWKTTWTRNEEIDMDLTDEEIKRLNEIARSLDEAKRGRPRKNPTPDQAPGEEDEHEHVIMQLRKVVSTHGALPVKHLDGKSTKITPQLAQHALNKHNAMKTAAEKQDFEHKLHKSHDSMKTALGG